MGFSTFLGVREFLRKFLSLIVLLLSIQVLYAQTWYDMTLEDPVKIEDVKKEAEKYFSNVGRGPHSGYKGYQRWLYNAELRMDENGYVYTDDAIVRSTRKFQRSNQGKQRRGATSKWSTLGPFSYTPTASWAPGQGRVTAIAVEAVNQQLIFAGSPAGGLWRSQDGGQSWVPLLDNANNLSIWAVAIDPNNSNRVMYLDGLCDLWESLDGGNNWSSIESFGNGQGRPGKILFNPSNSSNYFVATRNGLFKTTNGGTSFIEEVTSGVEDVEYKPGSTSVIYACGNDFWKSSNSGASFSKITNGITTSERMKLAVTSANSNYVYVIQKKGSGFGRMYRSTNSGDSFSIRSDIDNGAPNYVGSQAGRDMAIMCSNTDANTVHIAGLNNYRSTNGGTSFSALALWNRPADPSYIHADVEVMINVNGTLYAGTDGGIYRSNNNGDNYTDLTINGLAVSQYYRIGGSAPHPGTGAGSDPNRVVCGAQDNGTMVCKGPNYDWLGWLGADGMSCMIDHNNDNIIYGTTQRGGSLYRSTDGGNTSRRMNRPVGQDVDGSWLIPFEMDPVTSTTLYIGYSELYVSTNSGVDWRKITNNLTNGSNIDEIAIAPSNNNYIYISENGRFWVTKNGKANSPSWQEKTTGLAGNVNYIGIDPNDPEHVVVANSGSRIYETKNAGNSWTSIKGALPSAGFSSVVMDNTPENGIYLGTLKGIYYKNDNEPWSEYGTGFPNVETRELEINYQTGMLRAGTWGRGLWEISTLQTDLTPVIVNISNITKCEGETVQLSVNVQNDWKAPVTYQWFKDGVVMPNVTSSSIQVNEEAKYYAKVVTGDARGNSNSLSVLFLKKPALPNVTMERICGAGEVTLRANGSGDGEIKWFETANSNQALKTGNSFTTSLSSSKTYYVKEFSVAPSYTAGRKDTSGISGGFHIGDLYLVIDVESPFTLKSTVMYAEGAGNRTIQLIDEDGNELISKVVNIPDGRSRVNLNLDIPSGRNLRLGVAKDANLYRNRGAIEYPFSIDGVVTIKTSTANQPDEFYYYFYDWDIQLKTASCSSPSSEARAVVLTPADAPTLSDLSLCSPQLVTLSAEKNTEGVIYWYNEEGVKIGEGDEFDVQVNETSTYSANLNPEKELISGGSSLANAVGGNHAGNYGLVIDAEKPFTLSTVKMRAEGAGDRVVKLFDNNNNLMAEKTINLISGDQTVDLNLYFEKGDNYKLFLGPEANVFRSNENVTYPQNYGGVATVTSAFKLTDSTTLEGFYYYFYDWEIKEEVAVCESGASEMTIEVQVCTGVSDYLRDDLNAFPNPSSGLINLEIPDDFGLTAIEVTDINGVTQLAYGEKVSQIILNDFSKGQYFVKVQGNKGVKVFKILVK